MTVNPETVSRECVLPYNEVTTPPPLFATMATIIKKYRLSVLKSISYALVESVRGEVIGESNVAAVAMLGLASTCVYATYMYAMRGVDEKVMGELLDKEEDCLAIELVEEDRHTTVGSSAIVTWNGATAAVRVTEAVNTPPRSTTENVGHIDYMVAPVETRLHRKVPRKAREKYTNLIVAECKMVFGTPKSTEANHKAVRRVAVKLLKNHGVRPSHINVLAPRIIELVFIPSRHELEAKRLANSGGAWCRLSEFIALSGIGPAAWFSDGG